MYVNYKKRNILNKYDFIFLVSDIKSVFPIEAFTIFNMFCFAGPD
jgi:hypothetical protein